MRLMEAELSEGNIYTALFTLQAIENQVIRCNTRLEWIANARVTIGFCILDKDLLPTNKPSLHYIHNGIIDATQPDQRHHAIGRFDGTLVHWDKGFFKDYESPDIGPLVQEQAELEKSLVFHG